ncbi:ankyrin repeat domain-containing protein 27-like isoform X1 [Temnothorax curvispinosus]|uniref:Ankyrin repeat domain-containing protein 27-like isoform X1 n=2 Tax=Temnothorax curvispinosus TaxID=300111 RepID=A0A6J1QSA0_9HYME|nr:ankyrin repeat domain-containing protein 27-like isoform X1 [Temnothorax curvispinosus]
MNAGYDEDLSENRFLQALRDEHSAMFLRAVQEGWIICVPRSDSFASRRLQENEVNAHILVPGQDLSVARFSSLSGREILLEDRVLHVNHNDVEQYSSRLLFEEIFYSDDLRKYRVWCIERPLEASMCVSDDCVSVITNLQEAVNFLQVELPDRQLRNDFEAKIKDFLYINKNLERKPLQVQRDLVHELYASCLEMLLENASLRERAPGNKQYQWNVRVSLETYVLYALRDVLLKSLSACTAIEDANLNKIIRNLDGIQLSDLRVRSDLQSRVHGGKVELSRLDCFVTVLGKIECLRRTVNYVSRGTSSSVTSDDLLPVLVFLVVNAGLSNWTAQLCFMRQFRLSTSSAYEADETGFLITSLEAAIMHIKSGVIYGEEKCANNLEKYGQLMNKSERSSVGYLFACIKNGNLSEVKRILTYDGSNQVNDVTLCHPLCTCASCERNWTRQRDLKAYPKDDKGLTPLHVSVLHDQIVIVDHLLDRDTDINAVDSNGMTALHYACIKGHQNILLLLLHANANPAVTDSRGNTPLHLAVDRGHESCVKALLYLSEHMRMPINVSVANDNGDTPLHLAARWGYCAIVDILLEYGASCKITNKKGQSPSMVTYSETIAESLRCNATSSNICHDVALSQRRALAQPRQSVPFQQRRWATLENKSLSHPKSYANAMQHRMMDKLFAAITDGDVCLACYYLGLEVYRERAPGARANLCHHPLCDCERCSAIGEGKLEQRQRQRALTINACNGLGETALHVASATGRTRMVQLLLDAGANVNVTTRPEGRTPLHLACLNDRVDAAKLLLNCATCDVDAKDHNGDTPLHLATVAGNVKSVGLLIRHGACTNVRNLQNRTPLRQAEERLSLVFSANRTGILKILKQNSAQPVSD